MQFTSRFPSVLRRQFAHFRNEFWDRHAIEKLWEEIARAGLGVADAPRAGGDQMGRIQKIIVDSRPIPGHNVEYSLAFSPLIGMDSVNGNCQWWLVAESDRLQLLLI